METENIRVCYCTSDPDFGEVLGRALGSGFSVGLSDNGAMKTGCCGGEQ